MKYIITLFLFAFSSLLGKTQDVLDGIYVKENTRIKKEYHSIYPIQINYVFDDDRNFKNTIKDKIKLENNRTYPVLDNYVLVDLSLKEIKSLVAEDSTNARLLKDARIKENKNTKTSANHKYTDPAKKLTLEKPFTNCQALFQRMLPNSKHVPENLVPSFLNHYLKSVAIADSDYVKEINVQVKPFLTEYLTPFYIKKTEVSNAEYREFLRWVRDSIAMRLLIDHGFKEFGLKQNDYDNSGTDETRLNWKINMKDVFGWSANEDYKNVIAEMYLPVEERYYRRKEIDTRKLIFDYKNKNQHIKVQVYPDTCSWFNDFPALYNMPKPNLYFWHPVYDEEPVVGINVEQIEAFLFWKTKMYNQELHRKGLKHTVSFQLPDEMQWELASCAQLYGAKNELEKFMTKNADHSFLFDLAVKPVFDTVSLRNMNGENRVVQGVLDPVYVFSFNGTNRSFVDWENAGTYQKPAENKKHQLKDIKNLNNNVSEWTSQAADSNYLKLLHLRWQILDGYKSAKLYSLAYMAMMNYAQMAKGTQIVRGANWFDERTSEIEGINAKCLANPQNKYSAIGFRYVMKIQFPDK
jgi:formylglycine-generating enzyme required for sulfatase activity